jgi:hypothetical protein
MRAEAGANQLQLTNDDLAAVKAWVQDLLELQ